MRGPAVMWAGHPHLRGFVAMPVDGDPAAIGTSTFALECGVLGGMQALDGFWFAARREAALAVGFDGATFDGFHFYDLDFTYRAHLAGLRVAVTTDIVCLHRSHGILRRELAALRGALHGEISAAGRRARTQPALQRAAGVTGERASLLRGVARPGGHAVKSA